MLPFLHVEADARGDLTLLLVLAVVVGEGAVRVHQVHDDCVVHLKHKRKDFNLLPTRSDERGVFGVGSIPVVIRPPQLVS